MTDLLVAIRAFESGATLLVAGVLFFDTFVADSETNGARSRRALVQVAAIVGLISGAAWIAVQAAILGESLSRDADARLLATLIVNTQFGRVMAARLLLFLVLIRLLRWPGVGATLGAILVVSLAWCGHAAAGSGQLGLVHLVADCLHLAAAAAWLGGLVSLAGALHRPTAATVPMVRRFSTLGVAAVSTLAATGLTNSAFLVGTVGNLVTTPYGRALTLKLLLFCCMLCFAGMNRWWVLPRLQVSPDVSALRRNTVAEAILGGLVVLVVAWLGVQPPAAHVH